MGEACPKTNSLPIDEKKSQLLIRNEYIYDSILFCCKLNLIYHLTWQKVTIN